MIHEVLFSESFIEISYNPENKWIYADWKGFQTTRMVKAGCELMLDGLKKHGCYKVLNDNTKVEGIWSGASEWVAIDWFPRMRAAGMQWFGWIYSPSVFSQLSTDKTLNYTNEGFVKTFYSLDTAESWLQSL